MPETVIPSRRHPLGGVAICRRTARRPLAFKQSCIIFGVARFRAAEAIAGSRCGERPTFEVERKKLWRRLVGRSGWTVGDRKR